MTLKVVVAPDSYKGSLTAFEVAESITSAFKSVWPDSLIEQIPLADGGEGTTHALVHATGGRIVSRKVTGPLGVEVPGFFGILGDGQTAVVEMAAASGLQWLSPHERNPLKTTTRGTGELIRAALDAGCTKIIVGIGGSATNDGGVGMAQALGASFRDARGNELSGGAEAILALESIDLSGIDRRLSQATIVVACDVQNPLIGPEGAARVYGPQKGATADDVERLEAAMLHLAQKIEARLGLDVASIPGGGAAGGLGAGLIAFARARLVPGIDLILETVRFHERVRGADVVITGEGMVDGQTVYGKTPYGVLKAAQELDVPVVVIAGGLGADVHLLEDAGFAALVDCTPRPMDLDEATQNAKTHVEQAALGVARLLKIGASLSAGK